MSSSSRESRKVKRVRLERPMRVVIASIGAHIRYETTARDISHTGFFLEFDSPARFPFNQSNNEGGASLTIDNKILYFTKCIRNKKDIIIVIFIMYIFLMTRLTLRFKVSRNIYQKKIHGSLNRQFLQMEILYFFLVTEKVVLERWICMKSIKLMESGLNQSI